MERLMPIFSSVRQTAGPLGRGSRPAYKFRQIITRGYINGGYANSVPWRNVNNIVHATDTATSLGDLLQSTHNYAPGAHGRDRAFMFGGGAHGSGGYAYTSVFNMRNDTTYTQNSAMNSPVVNGDAGTVQQEWYRAWIFNTAQRSSGGTGSNTGYRFDFATETPAGTFTPIANGDLGTTASYDDLEGHIGAGNHQIVFSYATETQTALGNRMTNSGQQQSQGSKNGLSWAGNEGSYNEGNNFRRWNFTTRTVTATMGKPITNSGEENFDMGQDWGYMLGMFNGAQNNRAWKWTYATETGFEGGATMQPKGGQSGRSSGACAWRD